MFPIRRAALRLLSSPSFSIATRPRTYSSFIVPSLRVTRPSATVQLQRRWATSEAEAQREDEEAPITKLQPSAQEEVENAIAEDNSIGATSDARAAPTEVVAEAAEDTSAGATPAKVVAEAVQETSTEGATPSFPTARAPAAAAAEVDENGRPLPKASIFVGNLFFDVTESDLEKEFSRHGKVNRVRIIRDSRGLSKGFGYLDFSSTEDAQRAVDEANQQLFEGRRLNVQFAARSAPNQRKDFQERRTTPQNPESKTLFIGNMSFEMTDRDLNNLFRGIRNVIDVRVAIDRRTGQPRGFAHADFIDVASAREAMTALEGKETYGRKLRLDYSYGPSTAPRNVPKPAEEI